MRQIGSVFLVLALLAGFVGGAAADPTFLEAKLNIRVAAQIGPDAVQWQVDSHDQTGASADLHAGTTISDGNSTGSISTFSSAQATWTSNGQGSVHFGDTGFVQAAFTAGANSNVDQSGWLYTFDTTDEDTFTLSYAVATSPETDDPTGLGGFVFAVLQGNQTIYYQDLDLNTAYTLVVPLSPNQRYTATIVPVVELAGGMGLTIASMEGDFDWSITVGGDSQGKHDKMTNTQVQPARLRSPGSNGN